jgi:hypothetical protein
VRKFERYHGVWEGHTLHVGIERGHRLGGAQEHNQRGSDKTVEQRPMLHQALLEGVTLVVDGKCRNLHAGGDKEHASVEQISGEGLVRFVSPIKGTST